MLTVLCFAICDVITKYLTSRYPVTEVMAVRYISSFLILFLFVFPNKGTRLWRANNPKILLVRGLLMCVGSVTVSYALKLMPLGETIALIYLSPFLVIAMSVPILGEKVTKLGWAMTILGFCGVLLVLNLSGELNPVGVACAITNAICIAIFHVITKKIAATESNMTMLFYVNTSGLVVFSLVAIPSIGESQMPTLFDGSMMLLLGIMASIAHGLFSAAYREAPASLLAPINYVHLIWAALLSWLIFDHIPNAWTFAGISLILVSGVVMSVNAHYERKKDVSILSR
jgi:drug/metabolite transporter (DMT)-like permease